MVKTVEAGEGYKEEIEKVLSNGVVKISSREDLLNLPGRPTCEQNFGGFLLEKFGEREGVKILYEPITFMAHYIDKAGNERIYGATPDFMLEKPGVNGKTTRTFIELTTSEKNGTDPKKNKKAVMDHFPDIKYVVLYRKDLLKVEEKNPGHKFIKGKRLTREGYDWTWDEMLEEYVLEEGEEVHISPQPAIV